MRNRLINPIVKEHIRSHILFPLLQSDYQAALQDMVEVLDQLYANIPDRKRVSFGVVFTIKVLAELMVVQLCEAQADIFKIASHLFKDSKDHRYTGVALGILASYPIGNNFQQVLPYFELSAASNDWEVREYTQMFFRRLIKQYPGEAKVALLKLVHSEDANIRRFVSETLRPVQENRWFYRQPEYSLEILRHLFREKATYPRTSVGNNLSDLARRLPDLVYHLVEELVNSGDENSYWIAYRACRNLVKVDPTKVMALLRVKQYNYKDRKYQLE